MREVVLETQSLTRHFGGLAAVSNVSLQARHQQVHAVIGPNGAGKSTLINMLSGDLAPSSGKILFAGENITGLPAHAISQRGVGRSYQKTNVFLAFSAFENCRLAAHRGCPGPMGAHRTVARCATGHLRAHVPAPCHERNVTRRPDHIVLSGGTTVAGGHQRRARRRERHVGAGGAGNRSRALLPD